MSAVCPSGGQLGAWVTAWAGAPRPGCRHGSVTSQLGDFGEVRQFLKAFVSLRMKRVLIVLPPRVTEKLQTAGASTPHHVRHHNTGPVRLITCV